ncbi:unnamed protein product [Closterium sp. Naga37s-1]|nr:unnamed protein product [Closterium sp. Naga37s-1]
MILGAAPDDTQQCGNGRGGEAKDKQGGQTVKGALAAAKPPTKRRSKKASTKPLPKGKASLNRPDLSPHALSHPDLSHLALTLHQSAVKNSGVGPPTTIERFNLGGGGGKLPQLQVTQRATTSAMQVGAAAAPAGMTVARVGGAAPTGGRVGAAAASTGVRVGAAAASTGGRVGAAAASTGVRVGGAAAASTGGRVGAAAASTGGRVGGAAASTGGRVGGAAASTGGRVGEAAASTGGRVGGAAASTGGRVGGAAASTGGRVGGAAASTGGRVGAAAASTGVFRPRGTTTVRTPPPGPTALAAVSTRVAQTQWVSRAEFAALRKEMLQQFESLRAQGVAVPAQGLASQGSDATTGVPRPPSRSAGQIALEMVIVDAGDWKVKCRSVITEFFWLNDALHIQMYPSSEEAMAGLSTYLSPDTMPHLQLLWKQQCPTTKGAFYTACSNTRCAIGKILRRLVLTALGREKNKGKVMSLPAELDRPAVYRNDAELVRDNMTDEWGLKWHVDQITQRPFSTKLFAIAMSKAFRRRRVDVTAWKTRMVAFALFSLENPLLEAAGDGKLGTDQRENRRLFELTCIRVRRWVEHYVNVLGVTHDATTNAWVFENGVRIDASDYPALLPV